MRSDEYALESMDARKEHAVLIFFSKSMAISMDGEKSSIFGVEFGDWKCSIILEVDSSAIEGDDAEGDEKKDEKDELDNKDCLQQKRSLSPESKGYSAAN